MSEHIGEVAEIMTYPLTGARGVQHESAMLGRAGFEGDHAFVLYEEDKDGSLKRVSQRQYPVLAQIVASVDEEGNACFERDPNLVKQGAEPWGVVVPALARASLIDVVEFGDVTPCHDMGPEAARAFFRLLGKETGLARKTDEWLRGCGAIAPVKRANATVHIALAETVEFLADKLSSPDIGADRTRAQLIVRGSSPLSDAEWVGGTLLIGDKGLIEIDRHAKRCPVPGHDQITGQNMKDLPRAYPYTVKAPDDRKPTIGVYGHSVSDEPVEIRRGDIVRWVQV